MIIENMNVDPKLFLPLRTLAYPFSDPFKPKPSIHSYKSKLLTILLRQNPRLYIDLNINTEMADLAIISMNS